MTMHLVTGATSLNTRKPKAKITKAKLEQYQKDLASRNKELKRQGRHSECMTLDQYIDYVTGSIKNLIPDSMTRPLLTRAQLTRIELNI